MPAAAPHAAASPTHAPHHVLEATVPTGRAPLHGVLQETAHTPARHAQPRPWIQAVRWATEHQLHPKLSHTTMRIARDLAARMDYDRGWVLYDLEGTCARTGLSPATVKRHVAYLRETGLLAWQRHGSKTNLRLPGRAYTATATIYAATIPPAYDHATGRTRTGTGYHARVTSYTEAGRHQAVHQARARQQEGRRPTRPHTRAQTREPHSLGGCSTEGKVQTVGGFNNTAQARRTNSSSNGTRRHPRQVEHDITIARHVRPLVNWTQTEQLRRLAHALRPLIDQGLDPHQIAAELTGMCPAWRPTRPANYIRAVLHRDQEAAAARLAAEHAAAQAAAHAGDPHAHSGLQDGITAMRIGHAQPAPDSADEDLQNLRLEAQRDITLVQAAIHTAGEDYARTLYGADLVRTALAARSGNITLH